MCPTFLHTRSLILLTSTTAHPLPEPYCFLEGGDGPSRFSGVFSSPGLPSFQHARRFCLRAFAVPLPGLLASPHLLHPWSPSQRGLPDSLCATAPSSRPALLLFMALNFTSLVYLFWVSLLERRPSGTGAWLCLQGLVLSRSPANVSDGRQEE